MSTLNVNALDKESGSTLTLGGAGTTVAVHASATTSGFDSGLASIQTFTSSGTWTKPAGITKVIVEVQGGGSSGNRTNTNGIYNAGAGGGYAKKLIDVSSISTATITVGTGGAELNSNGYGNAGGTSSWSDGTNTLTCTGGAAGANVSNVSRLGGTGSGGDINISGQAGGTQVTSGSGGDSQLGSGGILGSTYPPVGYGAGSGSAQNAYVPAGGDGIVIVTEYK
jgi:hypothetical protein